MPIKHKSDQIKLKAESELETSGHFSLINANLLSPANPNLYYL